VGCSKQYPQEKQEVARIDIEKTIARVEFPPEIWAWLDLVGEMIAVTQEEALERERTFEATTPYQHLLRRFINRDIGSLSAIYTLLRMELVYQAAAHIRLFCENVITLRYILLDPDERSRAFLDYAALDAYKIGAAYLQWESQTAKPQHVEAMSLQQAELEKRFAEVHGRYTYVARKSKKTREFKNWCNLSLKEQADKCGAEMRKLYAIGYRQLSAYVHGSAWALRRQEAYIRTGYDQTVVMIDFANLTRILLAVWVEWLKIMSQEIGWQVLEQAHSIVDRCNELDESTVHAVAKIRKQERGTATESESEAMDGEPRCVLCNEPAGEGSKSFSLTTEAKERFWSAYPDADPEAVLSHNVICAKCQTLSQEDRQKLAQRAIARELKSYRDFVRDQI
jgi:hypothetical protein